MHAPTDTHGMAGKSQSPVLEGLLSGPPNVEAGLGAPECDPDRTLTRMARVPASIRLEGRLELPPAPCFSPGRRARRPWQQLLPRRVRDRPACRRARGWAVAGGLGARSASRTSLVVVGTGSPQTRPLCAAATGKILWCMVGH